MTDSPSPITPPAPPAQTAPASETLGGEPRERLSPARLDRIRAIVDRHPESSSAEAPDLVEAQAPRRGDASQDAQETAQAPQSAEATDATPGGAEALPEAQEGEPTPTQVRKDWIALQKAKREVDAAAKRAREMTDRAERFQAQVGNWKQDPRAVLQSAGIDPGAFFQRMVDQALEITPPKDPVEEKVSAQVQPYIQALEEERKKMAQHQTMVKEANMISVKVLPCIDPAKHPTLVNKFGGDAQKAAIHVYREMENAYNNGEGVWDPAQAVEAIERYYESEADKVISSHRSNPKFKGRFSQDAEPGTQSSASAPSSKADPAKLPSQDQPKKRLNNNPALTEKPFDQYAASGSRPPLSERIKRFAAKQNKA